MQFLSWPLDVTRYLHLITGCICLCELVSSLLINAGLIFWNPIIPSYLWSRLLFISMLYWNFSTYADNRRHIKWEPVHYLLYIFSYFWKCVWVWEFRQVLPVLLKPVSHNKKKHKRNIADRFALMYSVDARSDLEAVTQAELCLVSCSLIHSWVVFTVW